MKWDSQLEDPDISKFELTAKAAPTADVSIAVRINLAIIESVSAYSSQQTEIRLKGYILLNPVLHLRR